MSDLIERLKARSTQLQIVGKYHADIDEAITALSPVLPDNVAELTAWLDEYTADEPMHSAVNSHYKLRRILKMLERQALEINILQDVKTMMTNEGLQTRQELQQRIEELQAQVKELKALNPNGIQIVTTHPPEYYAALQENNDE